MEMDNARWQEIEGLLNHSGSLEHELDRTPRMHSASQTQSSFARMIRQVSRSKGSLVDQNAHVKAYTTGKSFTQSSFGITFKH